MERKNYNRILTFGRRGKTAAVRLAARQALRSRASLRLHKTVKGRGMFQKGVVGAPKINPPSTLTLRSTILPRFSSAARRRGLKRLQRRATQRRSKFLRRRVNALQRQQNQMTISEHSITTARQLAARALQPFTDSIVPRNTLAPLTFLRPTRRVIKTEAEKRRAIV